MRKMLLSVFLAACPIAPALALTPANLQGKDGAGSTQYFGELSGTYNSQTGTLFPLVIFCDATTAGQCASVNSSGQLSVSAALASGSNTIGKVDILGNAGSSLDASLSAATAPSNGIATLGQYNSTLPTLSSGQTVANQVDSSGRSIISPTNLLSSFGSTFPSSGSAIGVSSSGNMVASVGCDDHKYSHITASGNTLLVQGVTSQTVKICGFTANFSGSAAQSVYLENTASTNANCTSTLTQIAGLITGNSSAPSTQGFYNARWGGLANTSGNGLCVNASGSGGVDVDVWYTQGS